MAVFLFDGKPEFWRVNKGVFKNDAESLLLCFLFPWTLRCLLPIPLRIHLQSPHHFQTPSHFCGVFQAQVAGITHLNCSISSPHRSSLYYRCFCLGPHESEPWTAGFSWFCSKQSKQTCQGKSTAVTQVYSPAWCCCIWDRPSFLPLASVLIGATCVLSVWVWYSLGCVSPSRRCHFELKNHVPGSQDTEIVFKVTDFLFFNLMFFLLSLLLSHWRFDLLSFILKNKKAGISNSYLIPAALRKCHYCGILRAVSTEVGVYVRKSSGIAVFARLDLPSLLWQQLERKAAWLFRLLGCLWEQSSCLISLLRRNCFSFYAQR